jgi:hypothetical protein
MKNQITIDGVTDKRFTREMFFTDMDFDIDNGDVIVQVNSSALNQLVKMFALNKDDVKSIKSSKATTIIFPK